MANARVVPLSSATERRILVQCREKTILPYLTMPRILALDIGSKRIGAASVDLDGPHIASPLTAWQRAQGAAERELLRYIAHHKVRTIVVGYPLSQNGVPTPQCEDIERFCRRLKKRAQIEILFVDEYLTTEESYSDSKTRSPRKARQRGEIDSLAARAILQSYLDGGESWEYEV